MSNEYKTITDAILAILESYKATALSEDLAATVHDVRKGKYVVTATVDKPMVFVMPQRWEFSADMAGGLSRLERGLYLFTGACHAKTQGEALDDVQCLLNNLENLLLNHSTHALWSGGQLGWRDGDNTPEVFSEVSLEPATDACIAHFTLMWSCQFRIRRNTL
jgi:hypothetical protein